MSLKWLQRVKKLVVDAGVRWSDDECYRLGASLSYYAVFSLFPLLLISVSAVGFVMGHDDALRSRLLDYVAKSGAPEIGPLLDETLASMQKHETARGVGAVVGIITLFIGASGVFSELESALDKIWRVKAAPSMPLGKTILHAIEDKALSFAVVIAASLALLLSVLLGTALGALGATTERLGLSPSVWIAGEALVSLGIQSLLFATMFRMIPHTHVRWADAFAGAIPTAVLFTCLKRLLSWYLSHLGSYAAYGAVGGFLGLLAWIYFASSILLFGAELSRVYAEECGSVLQGASPAKPSDKTRDRELAEPPDGRVEPHTG